MNMKKTIAAVSAAAVAMSAIAATVSADDSTEAAQGSITYDLVRETRTIDDGTATFNVAATGIDLTNATALKMTFMDRNLKWEETQFVVTVRQTANTGANLKTFKFCANNEKDNYSTYAQYVTAAGAITTDKSLAKGVVITIPVSAYSTDGLSTSTFNVGTAIDVVATSKHSITSDALKELNKGVMLGTAFDAATDSYDYGYTDTTNYIDTQFEVVSANAANALSTLTAAKTAYDNAVTANNTAKNTQPAIIAAAGIDSSAVSAILAKDTGSYAGATMTNDPFADATTIEQVNAIAALTLTNGSHTITAAEAATTGLVANDVVTTAVVADATTLKTLSTKYGVLATNVMGPVGTATSLLGRIDAASADATTALATAASNEATALTAYNTALATYQTYFARDAFKFSSVTNAGEKVHLYPMLTTLDGVAIPGADGIYTTSRTTGSAYYKADLIDYLEINEYNTDKPSQAKLGSKIGKVGYVNVLPVLNDIIANNSNVTFTFTTSALYVKTDVDAAKSNEYGEGFTEVKDKYWYHPTFNQHLYDANGYYGTENSGYVGTNNAWAFNLFSGGLVVNNKYTMALNDTATFDWGESTLSFDWEDITKDKVTNAKLLLEYMNLYTSTNWFWDSFTVTYSNGDAEDVGTGAGDEAETDVVEEEEVVEETEAPVEEETAVEETEAPVEETAENPTTGNAPIALAVIPVALAAAAVVAKKRG
jgi:hypothetical protein